VNIEMLKYFMLIMISSNKYIRFSLYWMEGRKDHKTNCYTWKGVGLLFI